MSCTENVCGTGTFTGPKPGDPDNNIYINANTVHGGIQVAWSYPATNSHAVAHSKLYRGLSADFSNAIELAIVSGTVYYDKINPESETRYYYWVRLVSVNGTLMDPVGPASALARPLGEQTLETLTGLINAGVLARDLQTEIEKITLNYSELLTEIANRIASNEQLSAALALVQAGVQESLGLIHQESIVRQQGQDALASQLLTIAAVNQSNAAAILTEQTARVTADSALATSIQQVLAATNNNAAAISTEATARTTADQALASQITTAQSTLQNNIASVQTSLETNIETIDGVVTDISAQYMAKVDVNGLVGGFGLYNDSKIIEAGFDVDRFWVGRANSKVKPFIIENDTVYINKARIKEATIDTLLIANNSVSGIYSAEYPTDIVTPMLPSSGTVVEIGSLNIDAGPAASTTTTTKAIFFIKLSVICSVISESILAMGIPIRLMRNLVPVKTEIRSLFNNGTHHFVFVVHDTIAPGTYTYKLVCPVGEFSTPSMTITDAALTAFLAKR